MTPNERAAVHFLVGVVAAYAGEPVISRGHFADCFRTLGGAHLAGWIRSLT